MIPFGKTRKIYTLISNARIVFIEDSPHTGFNAAASYDLEEFLQGGVVAQVRSQFGDCRNELLIVPDFWVGVKRFLIASGKRSLVDQYVKRKLKDEEPDIPDVEQFFDYVRITDDQGRDGVQVYYLLDALFSQVHQLLAACGLRPGRVTAPGLIWEAKLAARSPELSAASVFLINVVSRECFFYFFHQGRYLFSRDISFSEHLPADERLDALSFEIDQSCFLFTQKTKAYVDRILLTTTGEGRGEATALGARLGKPVADFEVEGRGDPATTVEELNVLRHFSMAELSAAGKLINLAHRQIRKELEWRLVQNAALVSGACLLLLLLGQMAFLQWWPDREWLAPVGSLPVEQRQILRKYNADIELLLLEARRPRVTDALSRLSRSLPEAIRLESFSLTIEPAPQLALVGQVRAAGADQLHAVLTGLEQNFKAQFPGSTPPPPTAMDIGAVEASDPDQFGAYRARMGFKLP